MDIAFYGLINKSMVYLDDVMAFSKKISDHLTNLQHIFDRCHKYGTSLNPRKSIFVVTKGKILGYVICKYGIVIDPKRTKSITATT